MNLDICSTGVFNAEVSASAVSGITAHVSRGTGFDLEDIAANHVPAVGSDLGAVRQDTSVFFNFEHRSSSCSIEIVKAVKAKAATAGLHFPLEVTALI